MKFPKLVVKDKNLAGVIVSTTQLAEDRFETIMVKDNSTKAWGNPTFQGWFATLEEAMETHRKLLGV